MLTWRHRLERSQAWNTRYAGKPAGYRTRQTNTSYVQINLNGKKLFAHRLAFLMMTGKIPKEVDHRDMDGLNNRFGNLRPCTRSQNKMNRGWQRNAKIKLKGVSFTHTGRCRASVSSSRAKSGTWDASPRRRRRTRSTWQRHAGATFRGVRPCVKH